MKYKVCRQAGFSLVELMISLVLGLIIVGGAVNAFISSKQTYTLQEAMSRVQESGRFALDLMAKDLRLAGLSDTQPSNPPVVGYKKGESSLPTVIISGITSASVYIRRHDRITGDIAFYVAPDGTTGIPTLYRGNQPMVEGIEDIRLEYGLDTDQDDQVDTFETDVDAVGDWDDLIAVRIAVLAASGQGQVVDQRMTLPADFGGTVAADNRYYQAYRMTVTLRNVRLDKPT